MVEVSNTMKNNAFSVFKVFYAIVSLVDFHDLPIDMKNWPFLFFKNAPQNFLTRVVKLFNGLKFRNKNLIPVTVIDTFVRRLKCRKLAKFEEMNLI